MDNKDLIVRLLKEKYELKETIYRMWQELDQIYSDYHRLDKEVPFPIKAVVKCIDLADNCRSCEEEWYSEED